MPRWWCSPAKTSTQLKHWLLILRGILLKGAGIGVFWRELLSLVVLGLVLNAVTIFFLRRRLE